MRSEIRERTSRERERDWERNVKWKQIQNKIVSHNFASDMRCGEGVPDILRIAGKTHKKFYVRLETIYILLAFRCAPATTTPPTTTLTLSEARSSNWSVAVTSCAMWALSSRLNVCGVRSKETYRFIMYLFTRSKRFVPPNDGNGIGRNVTNGTMCTYSSNCKRWEIMFGVAVEKRMLGHAFTASQENAWILCCRSSPLFRTVKDITSHRVYYSCVRFMGEHCSTCISVFDIFRQQQHK